MSYQHDTLKQCNEEVRQNKFYVLFIYISLGDI